MSQVNFLQEIFDNCRYPPWKALIEMEVPCNTESQRPARAHDLS